jgi:hypothetical protein
MDAWVDATSANTPQPRSINRGQNTQSGISPTLLKNAIAKNTASVMLSRPPVYFQDFF